MLKQASFNWALNGSWEEFEEELGRVLRKVALAAPPSPTILNTITKQLAPVTDAFTKAPSWGQGALIGAGIGALGGALTDKKKRLRGLLQGAVVGGGLGALGGYGYGQMGGGSNNSKATNLSKEIPQAGPKGNPQGIFGKAVDTAADVLGTIGQGVGYTGDAVSTALKSPITYGLGGLYGSHLLTNAGKRQVSIVGTPNQIDPGKGVVQTVPSTKSILEALRAGDQSTKDWLNTLIHQHAINPGGGKPPPAPTWKQRLADLVPAALKKTPPAPPPGPATPQRPWVSRPSQYESAKNYQDFISGGNRNPDGTVNFVSGRKTIKVKPEDLAVRHQQNLAHSMGEPKLPNVDATRRKLMLQKGFGRLGSLVSLATFGSGVKDAFSQASPDMTTIAPMKPVFDKTGPGEAGIKNLIEAAKRTADPRASLVSYAERSGWTPEQLKAVYDRMMGVNP